MSTTYTKSLSTDFGGSLSTSQLHAEIEADTNITTILESIDLDGDVVEITFAAALSAGEETALDNLIASHIKDTSKPKTNFYTVNPRLDFVHTTSYKSTGAFKFPGSTAAGIIDYIEIISHMDEACTSYSIRVYDLTNGAILAEATGLDNTSAKIQDLGVISNIPSDPAVLEVQLKRVGGSNSDSIYLDSVLVYYDN